MVDYIKTVAGLSRSLGRRYAPVPNSDRFVEIVDTIVGDEIVTPLGKVRKRGPEQRGRFDVLASDLDPIVADVVPPVITCPLVYMIAENTPLTITLTANEPVTWTKTGGEDSAAFPITGGNTINFTAKDFDNPSDYLLNNTFFGSFRATDAAGNATDFEIVVNITNVLEGAMAAISPTTATVDDAALSSLVVLNLPAMVEGESRSYIPTTGPQFVFNSAGKLIRGLSAFVSGTATGKVRQSRGGVNTDTNVTITLTATPAVTRVIATRGEVPINLGAATTTEAQRRLKLRSVHYFGQQGFTEIQVAFANYAVYNFNDLELSPGNTCDIEGSIEIPDAPTPVVRFKFSNANVATLADGEPLKISDVIPASAFGLSIDQALALADTRFFIKHTRTVPLGGKHVKAAALQTSVVPGDMAVSCDPALDTDPITNPGQLAFGAAPYTLYTDIIPPLAVLGKTRAKQVSVFGAGDSITYGANDLNGAGDGVTRGGHFQRAMHGVNGHHIPFIRLQVSST